MVAFLEGIGIKTNELISTMNLYRHKNSKIGYLIISEIIFCLIRSLILSLFYIFQLKLKYMYLLV